MPAGRFAVAFDDNTLVWNPTWTLLDQVHPNLVTSYSIDRGRQYELDRTEGGRATVQIIDPDGVLDPTNLSSPYAGNLEPLKQAAISRLNPVTGQWHERFRGFIEDFTYDVHPSQRVTMLTVNLVDIFEILSAVEMVPGKFGDDPMLVVPPRRDWVDQVYYDDDTVQHRIEQILNDSLPSASAAWWVVFTGNVRVWETVYSPGETALTAIQEAADAEFPGVSNVYTDRFGRICFHGRLSKFDPEGVSDTASDWDWHQWKAGDGAAVQVDPDNTAHLRRIGFNRGLAKIINSAIATPVAVLPDGLPPTPDQIADQLVEDTASQGKYGIRSWSAQSLITETGLLDSSGPLDETKKFAQYYIDNYSTPQTRVTENQFRTMRPGNVGAAATWEFLSKIDISDAVDILVDFPGGGGLTGEAYFVEGIHEQCSPGPPEYDDVTVTLDLSPRAYYSLNPFPS